MEQFRPKTTPPLANPERLTGHCEELFELIASLNNILNLYMPAGRKRSIASRWANCRRR
jgi:ATP-dependent DNA helicase DinG